MVPDAVLLADGDNLVEVRIVAGPGLVVDSGRVGRSSFAVFLLLHLCASWDARRSSECCEGDVEVLASIDRAIEHPDESIAIQAIVRLDQKLVVSLSKRDGDLRRIEFLGMIQRRDLLAVQIDDRPIVQAKL